MNLATKYRPKSFKDVVGQDITIKILQNQIKNNEIKNMLLSAPSGVGKTTIARIIANELKAHIIEVDAASNNSVDNIRELIKLSNTSSITHDKRVIILDEAHSLSNNAFQALLKTLEDGNNKTLFIFCTTDAHKIPMTILSRLQRFNLSRIPSKDIYNRLKQITKLENINIDDVALAYISDFLSNGSLRDALMYLDRVVSSKLDKYTINDISNILTKPSIDEMLSLTKAILETKDKKQVYDIINNIYYKGIDLKEFMENYFKFILSIVNYKISYDKDKYNIHIDITYLNNILNITKTLKTTNTNIREYLLAEVYLLC